MVGPHRRVALVLDKSVAYWRRIVRGMLDCPPVRTDWTLHSVPQLDDAGFQRIARWKPHGLIMGVPGRSASTQLRRLGVPCIDIALEPMGDWPRVEIDHAAVGRFAAEHFLERNLRHFAFFGSDRRTRDTQQHDGLLHRVHESHPEAEVAHAPPMSSPNQPSAWAAVDDALGQWLTALPRPVGLLISDDEASLWLSQVCQQRGLSIPDDVALLGVHDDPVHCEMARPVLSSIQTPLEQLGRHACELLVQAMNGEPLLEPTTRLQPLGVSVRQSTNLLMVEDKHLRDAIRFIRASADRPITVEDVLDQVPVSRRILEKRFREHLGRTPLQEIRRAHLSRARHILASTDLVLHRVAEASGFTSVYHFCRVYKREFNETPTEYRRRFVSHRKL